jgi:hypothetical protein
LIISSMRCSNRAADSGYRTHAERRNYAT